MNFFFNSINFSKGFVKTSCQLYLKKLKKNIKTIKILVGKVVVLVVVGIVVVVVRVLVTLIDLKCFSNHRRLLLASR